MKNFDNRVRGYLTCKGIEAAARARGISRYGLLIALLKVLATDKVLIDNILDDGVQS